MVNQFLVELLVDCLVSRLMLSLRGLRSRMGFSVAQFEVRDVVSVLVFLRGHLFWDVSEETGGVV